MAPSRVAETLASSLVADPLFCDLLANLHPHLEHEVDLDRVVGIRRTSAAAAMSLADAIEQASPALGRSGALDVLLAVYSSAAPLSSCYSGWSPPPTNAAAVGTNGERSAEANCERPVDEPEIMTDTPDVAYAHDN